MKFENKKGKECKNKTLNLKQKRPLNLIKPKALNNWYGCSTRLLSILQNCKTKISLLELL